jgi:hypothetical protein
MRLRIVHSNLDLERNQLASLQLLHFPINMSRKGGFLPSLLQKNGAQATKTFFNCIANTLFIATTRSETRSYIYIYISFLQSSAAKVKSWNFARMQRFYRSTPKRQIWGHRSRHLKFHNCASPDHRQFLLPGREHIRHQRKVLARQGLKSIGYRV